jgi:hypothetical protein
MTGRSEHPVGLGDGLLPVRHRGRDRPRGRAFAGAWDELTTAGQALLDLELIIVLILVLELILVFTGIMK